MKNSSVNQSQLSITIGLVLLLIYFSSPVKNVWILGSGIASLGIGIYAQFQPKV